ncbi:MAG: hypothetical protein RRC07_06240 [Anaerolineae bacterium]|nr:hypothetical protein [Anaerolineae bacterium]
MSNPVILLIVLLLALALTVGAAAMRRERTGHVALAGTVLVFAGLLATRRPAVAGSSDSFPWAWAIAEANWWPSLAFVLLALTALLTLLRQHARRSEVVPVLLLFAAALAAAWADSPAALVTTWVILGAGMALVTRREPDSLGPARYGIFWLAPLLLWLAAAASPAAGDAVAMDARVRQAGTEGIWLLAAIVAIGAFPFQFWHRQPSARHSALNTLLLAAPALAGAVLLATFAGGAGTARYALPATLAGLLGLLWAAYEAWRQRRSAVSVAASLLLAEASLLVLLAVWGDQAAILAETRVLLLAGGAFVLAAGTVEDGTWQRLALVPAFAALAAFPATAGFAGRGMLYTAWLDSGNGILVAVAVLLQVPMLAAGLTLVWPRTWPPGPVKIGSLLLLLPALGLLSWQAMGEVAALAWGTIALQLVGALLLFRFATEAEELEQALQQALAPKLEIARALAAVQRGGRAIADAVRDAAGILEGGGGLLWVLFFLIVIWLAR